MESMSHPSSGSGIDHDMLDVYSCCKMIANLTGVIIGLSLMRHIDKSKEALSR